MKKKKIYFQLILVFLGVLTACSTTKNISTEQIIPREENLLEQIVQEAVIDSTTIMKQVVEEIKDTAYETGNASWYGPKYHGRQTASGEIFNQYDLSAAHKTLPFKTMVKVVNKSNNKSIIVKINDRGPFIKSRIIDLSRKAAEQIGIIQKGFEMVDIFIIKDPILKEKNK